MSGLLGDAHDPCKLSSRNLATSLEANPQIPNPVDCSGWIIDEEGRVQINWMTGSPAPVVVLEFMSCKCKHVCSLPVCQ